MTLSYSQWNDLLLYGGRGILPPELVNRIDVELLLHVISEPSELEIPTSRAEDCLLRLHMAACAVLEAI